MGGSAFGQVYNNMSGDAPDLDDTGRLKDFYGVIQQLVAEDKLLAYHDRSDGGLFATLAEMAFAGRCGLDITLGSILFATMIATYTPAQVDHDLGFVNAGSIISTEENIIRSLFNEELGAVLQVRAEDADYVLKQFDKKEFFCKQGRLLSAQDRQICQPLYWHNQSDIRPSCNHS